MKGDKLFDEGESQDKMEREQTLKKIFYFKTGDILQQSLNYSTSKSDF